MEGKLYTFIRPNFVYVKHILKFVHLLGPFTTSKVEAKAKIFFVVRHLSFNRFSTFSLSLPFSLGVNRPLNVS